MKMKNHEIAGLVEFLNQEELGARLSRMRSRFTERCKERLQLLDRERMDLINIYCEKGEDGEPVIETGEDGQNRYQITDTIAFNTDYAELFNEEFIIEETSDVKEMLECVKQIVLNTIKTFKGDEGVLYSRWCDIVENIE